MKSYRNTAVAMAILSTIGLLTTKNVEFETLNVIFYIAFFPSVAIGLVTFFSGFFKGGFMLPTSFIIHFEGDYSQLAKNAGFPLVEVRDGYTLVWVNVDTVHEAHNLGSKIGRVSYITME